MAKKQSHAIIQLSRDEKLISPKDGKTLVRTARFLKPCAQTESQAVTVPNNPLLFDIFSQSLKNWPENVNIKRWQVPQKRWEEWVEKMAGENGGLWNRTGIFDAIMRSRYEIRCNKDLLLGLVEFWCPETNTFVFPWGEATVTLEDVMILGGFSTLGKSVTRLLEGESVKIEEEMKRKRLIMARNKLGKATHVWWIKHFMEEEEEREYEHIAFLSLWLSRYVFPSLPDNIVAKHVFPVAIHLSSYRRMALAPAVLASLYKNLTLLKNQAMRSPEEKISLTASGPLRLLQLWAFERFPSLGPDIPNTLKPGEPRAARFHRLNAKISLPLVRSVLRLADNFRWRPYTADLKNWGHPSYYKETKFLAFDCCNDPDEDLKSFARCLHSSLLVGLDCKEEYLPHRVARQFGYDQDLPAAFPVCRMSWKNARFDVPPRSFEPCATVRYFNWWNRSKSPRKAALRDTRRTQNRSSPSVLAKRNVEKFSFSIEFGVKKPNTIASKLSIKGETEGFRSSFANEYAPKTRTHVNSKGVRAMCSLKSTNSFSRVSADKNGEESHASLNSEMSSKVKRRAYKGHDDAEQAGFRKASPCCQFRGTTSKVPNGNLRKRKFSTIAGRSKATTQPLHGTAERQMNAGGSKLKRIFKKGRKAFDHANGPVDVTEQSARVEQKKRFEGSLKGVGKESKKRTVEGFRKNSENGTIKDTISGSLQKFGLELERRLRRLEKLAGISPK